jgi:hypothetical protein
MAISTLYEIDMGEQRIDVSAATRKFQTSIIVNQDPEKNGILSFLTTVEQETQSPPTRQAPQTMRPSGEAGGSSSGGYS